MCTWCEHPPLHLQIGLFICLLHSAKLPTLATILWGCFTTHAQRGQHLPACCMPGHELSFRLRPAPDFHPSPWNHMEPCGASHRNHVGPRKASGPTQAQGTIVQQSCLIACFHQCCHISANPHALLYLLFPCLARLLAGRRACDKRNLASTRHTTPHQDAVGV